ncbi:5'-3' exonuclease [[Mycoplasma] collis]|uniref:5'-3' exonuclease n=1 Tax=[Mycoplasma] collis TaxID=2127 RepID=UPI00051C6FA1|nr:5'-3' exonuclease [[Mycoplasma] collis]
MKNKILLVDANLLLFKSFYASYSMQQNLFLDEISSEFSANTVHIFFSSLFNVLKTYKPTHLYLAFDSATKTYRHNLNENYKSNRKKIPDEIWTQFDWIKKILSLLNVKYENIPTFEADDLIASFNYKYKQDNAIMVWSDDKDLLQLVDENTSILCKKQNKFFIKNYKNFEEVEGIQPSQVVDYKSMVGDKSDNLKGINGIGELTAKRLLKKYFSLNNIYNNLNDLTPSLQLKFTSYKEEAYLCQKLTKLLIDAPSIYDLKAIEIDLKFSQELENLLVKLNLNKVLSQIKSFLNDSDNR